MRNDANLTKAEVAKQSMLGIKKDQYDFSILLPEDNILNILSINASVVITDYEVLMGQVNFNGEACLNIVYSLDDGVISNYKSCENISGRFDDLGLDPGTLVKILPNIIDVGIEKAENNSIKIKLSLEYSLDQIKNQEINIYKSADTNIFTKESEIEIPKHTHRNCERFSQTTIFDTKLPVKQILNITSVPVVTKADSLDGIIVFEGEITTRILYVTDDDRPLLVSLINRDNFREEIEESRAKTTSTVEAFARIINRDIDERINKEDKSIEINIPVRICYDLFETECVTVTIDAFSTTHEVNLTTEAFLANKISGYEVVENKLDGNVTLDEQSLRIDKVLAVDGAYLSTTSQTFKDGELKIEGLVHLNVIFINDEEEQINSVSIEIPVSIKEKINEGESVKTESDIIEIDAVVKRGRDIYIDGKVRTAIWINKEVKNAIISAIDNGDAIPGRDGAIEIYFAKQGETFWDVAKDLKIPEQKLKSQNSEIIEPFATDEKIIFYDQRILPEV